MSLLSLSEGQFSGCWLYLFGRVSVNRSPADVSVIYFTAVMAV